MTKVQEKLVFQCQSPPDLSKLILNIGFQNSLFSTSLLSPILQNQSLIDTRVFQIDTDSGRIMVEHLTLHPKIKGSSPVADTGLEVLK